MQFNYWISYQLLSTLNSKEVFTEEEQEFSEGTPFENRQAAFDFFQDKLKENTTAPTSPVNQTSHSSKGIQVHLKISEENKPLETLTLYESTQSEKELLQSAQKELGFYKQYQVSLPAEAINNTLLIIAPRFTTQIVQ